MSMAENQKTRTLKLEAFLAGLPDEAAGHARPTSLNPEPGVVRDVGPEPGGRRALGGINTEGCTEGCTEGFTEGFTEA